MQYLLNAPFILDFIATISLFVISSTIVLIVKAVYFYVKTIFFVEKAHSLPPEKSVRIKKSTKRRAPKTIRSIEINPEEIDRIYVKKIS